MTKPTSLDRHLDYCHCLVGTKRYDIELDNSDCYGKVHENRTLLSLVAASAFYQAIEDDDKKKVPELKVRLSIFAYILDKISYLDITTDAPDDTIYISIVDFGLSDKFFKDILLGKDIGLSRHSGPLCIKVIDTITAIGDSPDFKFDQHSMKNLRIFFKRMFSTEKEETISILRKKIEPIFGERL